MSTSNTLFQSEYDKRQYAMKSHEFNLKDKIYCDLFPDLVAASKSIVQERKVNTLMSGVTNTFKELQITLVFTLISMRFVCRTESVLVK